jgi:hypothetical protein
MISRRRFQTGVRGFREESNGLADNRRHGSVWRAIWTAAASTPPWIAAEPLWLVQAGSVRYESQNALRESKAASQPPQSKWIT